MAKVTFIGGGSSKFIHALTRDLFTFPETQDIEIALMDIDPDRVAMTEALVQKMIDELKIPAKVAAGTNRREMLEGADYVIITIMVGRFACYKNDVEIPAKYGVYQAVSDTIGPGGVFRLMRTMPVLHGLIEDIRAVAPNAWVLNYSNPMAMNVWGMLETGYERVVGLCHSIQGQYKKMFKVLDIPVNEIKYEAAGINHLTCYLKLEHNGRDIYPDLLAGREKILEQYPHMKSSFDILDYFGYFPAEGGHHQTEYYPYFRKNEKLIEEYGAMTGWGYKVDLEGAENMAVKIPAMTRGEEPIKYERGNEFGAYIIHSIETGEPRLFHGNVRNQGLIENHPPQAVVEVPCHVDENGFKPCRVGRIPEQLAAWQGQHIAVHEMAVKGWYQRDRKMIERAIMLDPLTSAMCTLPQIREMVREMFEANREYIDW